MTELSVSGAARRLVRPDRGTARVLVRLEGADREEVVAAAAALHARLTADARRFVERSAAADWSADQVWVSATERYRGPKKKPKRLTVASATVRVTFTDAVALGGWLAELAEQDGAVVHGIDWTMSDEHRREVESAVRTEAVLDALDRARAYARAMGLETLELSAVAEPGLRRDEVGGGTAMYRMAGAGIAAAGESSAPQLELRAEEIELRAEVTADFTAR